MIFFKIFFSKIFQYISKGNERSIKAKSNIISLFFIKGFSVIINLMLIPLTLDILSNYKYGVWITIFSVLSWIEIFDIGIGNGLRNKFSESIARGNLKEGKEYISTAYIIMIFLSISVILIFYLPWNYVNWASAFNVNENFQEEIKYLIFILFSITVAQFSLKLINSILLANHKPAYPSLIIAISNFIVLLIFLVFKEELKDNLLGIGVIYTIIPFIIFVFFSFWMFSRKYKSFRPSFTFFDKNKVKDLFSLGGKFFFIQLAGIIIFQTDTLIISHVISPEEVTPYSITFRYFGVITMLSTLIMIPLWSAYTEAYVKKDFIWIRKIVKKQLMALIVIFPILIIMVFSGRKIITIWINESMIISSELLVSFAVYTFLSMVTGIFSTILGGISKVRLIMYMTIFTMILNIPLSIFFIKFTGNNTYGVIIATSICLLITAIGNIFQVKYFIFSDRKTAFLDKILQ
ncbi:MATE family efflux transporter [uncultured Polaribacter sp.]|uniref:MATE family efflux transporter n=1 Tax=uncultured Polaribacter sp. TaxID=174711 RepID=UPI002612F1ED|nr:MATE family efflux transporter [uncultured Polaribacter sp.]